MPDPRFFYRAGPLALEQLATITGATLEAGEPTRRMRDVAPLDRAGPDDIAFLDNVKYLEAFTASRAGACFLRAKYSAKAPKEMALLLTEDPYRCYALAAQRFYPSPVFSGVVSPHARIHATAKIGKGATIDIGAVIAERVEIGVDSHVGSNSVLHAGVVVGDNTRIGANCTLSHCLVGNRVLIHRGVHIGQDGFGFALGRDTHVKVPQLGRVVIEDDVEIGSGTCIDRGTGPDTFVGAGSKIDNLVQIGHNVHIGRQSILVAQTGVAGSVRIGEGAMLGGQSGVAGHLRIGAGARLVAQSGVMADVPPGVTVGGSPAVPVKDWHRQTIAIARLAQRKGLKDE